MKTKILVILFLVLLLVPSVYAEPTISDTNINYVHLGYDQDFFSAEDVWSIYAELHLAGDDFDPFTTDVSVEWSLNSRLLEYIPWFYDVLGIHSYWAPLTFSASPLTLSDWETDYTFQVEGGPSTIHSITEGTFVGLDLPVTTWDGDAGVLSWQSVEHADLYYIWVYAYDTNSSSWYGVDTIMAFNTSYNLTLDHPWYMIGVQAIDFDSGFFMINQSEYFTFLPASDFVSSILLGDFDNDCDVDGLDLSGHFLNYGLLLNLISVQDFADNFGIIGCP